MRNPIFIAPLPWLLGFFMVFLSYSHDSYAYQPIIYDKPCVKKFAGYGKRYPAKCYDYLPILVDGERPKPPRLIVIPPYNGKVYAIGYREITRKEFNAYCKSADACKPYPINTNLELPATYITIDNAEGYVHWIGQITKHKYRLPTLDEWLHAAKANTNIIDQDITYNCKSENNDHSLENSGSHKPNNWGMSGHIGNVQELVYGENKTLYVAGGSYKDDIEVCRSILVKKHAGQADFATGFRIVRDIDNR